MNAITTMNATLAGFFAFAALHYAIQWWGSRRERVLLVFSTQCLLYAAFSVAINSFFRARTVPEAQEALGRFVTIGVLAHVWTLQLYAHVGGRRDRAYRVAVTGLLVFLAIVNQWAPLRGTVLELRQMPMLGGETAQLAIRTPPGASLVLLYVAVLGVQTYGFVVAGARWKGDRSGAGLLALGAAAVLAGAALGFAVDFAHVRAPYGGAAPHAVFVVCMALYLSREYSARGARLAASEQRTERSLQETRRALAALQAEHRRREEAEEARHRAMEAVVQAQRKELAGQLAAGVAHDFNNVLGVMSVWSRLLMSGRLPASEQDRARAALERAQEQGESLSRQLMSLARPETRSVKHIPLDRLVRSTLQTLTAALPRNVRLSFESLDAPAVDADETELQQVLYNLVLNARDAMPDGGTIQVTAGVETSSVRIPVVGGSLPPGAWATLTVADSGPGVDPTIGAQIFDLFFTTKGPEGGTGLGLATVLRIAKASGGGIALESDAGRGATFKVYLRAADDRTAAEPATA